MFCLAMGTPRPVDVAKYLVLRNRSSHVFFALCFAQREHHGGTPVIRRICFAQPGEQVPVSHDSISGSRFLDTLGFAQWAKIQAPPSAATLGSARDGGQQTLESIRAEAYQKT